MARVRLATPADLAAVGVHEQVTPATLGELRSGDYTLSGPTAAALGLPAEGAGCLAIRWCTTGGAVRIATWTAVIGSEAHVWVTAWLTSQQTYGSWRRV